jgi:transposase
MVRLYGRAEAGHRLVDAVQHGHWQTSTSIVGLRQDGLVAPLCIRRAIKVVGAGLMYLPAYSPGLSPIEQAFAKLKAQIVARQGTRAVEALWNALGDIVGCFTPTECANYLRHAGYFQSG